MFVLTKDIPHKGNPLHEWQDLCINQDICQPGVINITLLATLTLPHINYHLQGLTNAADVMGTLLAKRVFTGDTCFLQGVHNYREKKEKQTVEMKLSRGINTPE